MSKPIATYDFRPGSLTIEAMKPKYNGIAAEHVNQGDYVHVRGELSRVREAGPAMHPRHGRIVRLVLESGAVLHYAPYASVSVLRREENQ